MSDYALHAEGAIIAFDLGTSCGVAQQAGPVTPILNETLDLQPARWEDAATRYWRLEQAIDERVLALRSAGRVVSVFVYEALKGKTRHAQAAQVLGGLEAVLLSAAKRLGVPYHGVPIATLKKFAADAGNANKDRMREALVQRIQRDRTFPALIPKLDRTTTDDAIDAVWLLWYARTNLPRLRG